MHLMPSIRSIRKGNRSVHAGWRAIEIRWPLRAAAVSFMLLLVLILGGCSLGSSSTVKATSSDLTPAQVPWCDIASITFIDSGNATQPTLSDWAVVSPQLGFTPYLPSSFPTGTCLVLAGGSVHDPVFGGRMVITWNVPGTGPLSFSEAPKRSTLASSLQCAQSSQEAGTTICLGTLGNTGITIASSQSASKLQALFNTLKPDVNWVPSNTNQLQATPSPTS
jgi:hypothetical protein